MFNILKILKLGGFSTLKRIISFLSNNLLTFKQIFGDIVKEGVSQRGRGPRGRGHGQGMPSGLDIWAYNLYVGFIVTFPPQ